MPGDSLTRLCEGVVKIINCGSCGGAIVASYFSEPKADNCEQKQKAIYYECPLCGPGLWRGPGLVAREEAETTTRRT